MALGSEHGLPLSGADLNWYLVFSKPRQERIAAEQLHQQGYEVYLPLYKKLKRTAEGPLTVQEPMFPRYLFVRPGSPGQSVASVRSTRGVTTLVRFGFEPASVPEALIEMIKTMEAERNAADLHQMSSLRVGQRVKLERVAMSDMEGLVQSVSSKRVQVLLEILGRPVSVQLEHHQITPVE